MRDTDYMEVFERSMKMSPVSQEDGLRILQKLGLELPSQPESEEGWSFVSALEAAGLGVWDYSDGTWVATSTQFYAFDAEFPGAAHMYEHYFAGLESITSDPKLTFRLQDYLNVQVKNGQGTMVVYFLVNGGIVEYNAQVNSDWIDTGIQRAINDFLELLGVEKRFYSFEASQGRIVFYCTETWARAFEEATLCFMSYDGV